MNNSMLYISLTSLPPPPPLHKEKIIVTELTVNNVSIISLQEQGRSIVFIQDWLFRNAIDTFLCYMYFVYACVLICFLSYMSTVCIGNNMVSSVI